MDQSEFTLRLNESYYFGNNRIFLLNNLIKACIPKLFPKQKRIILEEELQQGHDPERLLQSIQQHEVQQHLLDALQQHEQQNKTTPRKVGSYKTVQGSKGKSVTTLSSVNLTEQTLQSELSLDLPQTEQFQDLGYQVSLLQIIGQGGSSTVYKGQWKELEVAVKVIVVPLNQHDPTSVYKMKTLRKALEEAKLSRIFRHQNVVKTYYFFEKTYQQDNTNNPPGIENNMSQLNIIQEYCNLGDLPKLYFKDVIYNKQINQPYLEQILQLALDVARGLNYMHNLQVIHGDMKTSNVLLQYNKKQKRIIAKIGDFGMSCQLPSDAKSNMWVPNYGGTRYYAAPEVVEQGKKSQLSDIYSYGIILWELYQQQTPLAIRYLEALSIHDPKYKQKEQQFYQNVEAYRFPWECPPPYCLLSWWCQESQPHNRPTSSQLVYCLKVILRACKKGIIRIGAHNKELNMELGQTFLLMRSKQQIMPFMEIILMLCQNDPQSSLDQYIKKSPNRTPNRSPRKSPGRPLSQYSNQISISQRHQPDTQIEEEDLKTEESLNQRSVHKSSKTKQQSPETQCQSLHKTYPPSSGSRNSQIGAHGSSGGAHSSGGERVSRSCSDTPNQFFDVEQNIGGSFQSLRRSDDSSVEQLVRGYDSRGKDIKGHQDVKLPSPQTKKGGAKGTYRHGKKSPNQNANINSTSTSLDLIFKEKDTVDSKKMTLNEENLLKNLNKDQIKEMNVIIKQFENDNIFHTGSSCSFSSNSKMNREGQANTQKTPQKSPISPKSPRSKNSEHKQKSRTSSEKQRHQDSSRIQGALSMLNMSYGKQSAQDKNQGTQDKNRSSLSAINRLTHLNISRENKVKAKANQLQKLIQQEQQMQQNIQLTNYVSQQKKNKSSEASDDIRSSIKHLEYYQKLRNLQEEYNAFILEESTSKAQQIPATSKQESQRSARSHDKFSQHNATTTPKSSKKSPRNQSSRNKPKKLDMQLDLSALEKDTKDTGFNLDQQVQARQVKSQQGMGAKEGGQKQASGDQNQRILDNRDPKLGKNQSKDKSDLSDYLNQQQQEKGEADFDFEIPKLPETYPTNSEFNNSIFFSSTNKAQQLNSSSKLIDHENMQEQIEEYCSDSDAHSEMSTFERMNQTYQLQKQQSKALENFIQNNNLELPNLRSYYETGFGSARGHTKLKGPSSKGFPTSPKNMQSVFLESNTQQSPTTQGGSYTWNNYPQRMPARKDRMVNQVQRTVMGSGSGSIEDAHALLAKSIHTNSPPRTASLGNFVQGNYRQYSSNQYTFTSGYETYIEENPHSGANSPNTFRSNYTTVSNIHNSQQFQHNSNSFTNQKQGVSITKQKSGSQVSDTSKGSGKHVRVNPSNKLGIAEDQPDSKGQGKSFDYSEQGNTSRQSGKKERSSRLLKNEGDTCIDIPGNGSRKM